MDMIAILNWVMATREQNEQNAASGAKQFVFSPLLNATY